MAEEIIEEEAIEEVVSPEDDYQTEYDKAWSDEEELEQPIEEPEATDEIVEEEVVEDSSEETITDEGVTTDESEESIEEPFLTMRWNKQDIPLSKEEAKALAQKGFDANKKWQEASLSRPMRELVDANNVTAEDLQMFIDAKNGNAEALALLADKANIDMYDAEKKDYKPVVEEKNYALDDVIAEINQDEAIATQMNDYVSSVPQSVKTLLTNQPDVLRGLNVDMHNGIAQKVMPEVIKQLAINPNQDFVSLYQSVGQTMYSKAETPKVEKPTREVATREEKRKMSVSNRVPQPKKQIADDYDAAWDDDSHFNDVLNRLNGF